MAEAVVNCIETFSSEILAPSPPHEASQDQGVVLDVPIHSVIIAFGGVLCVALEGFPTPIVELKSKLSDACDGIAPELMGSKWAKVTVAAVRDDAEDRQTSDPAVWDRLRTALLVWNTSTEHHTPARLQEVSVVSFQCRSLAHHQVLKSVSLRYKTLLGDGSVESVIDPASHLKGAAVVEEFTSNENWASYRDNGIIARLQPAASYRQEFHGTTMVAFLVDDCWAQYLERLKQHLCDHDLGWLYEWMPNNVLHVTVRGL